MRKILGLSIAAVLVMALVGGGTWAYFSDPETSTGNVLTAGTLDLALSDADPNAGDNETNTWVFSNIRPDDDTLGDDVSGNLSEGKATLTLNNNGSIDGYLDLANISIVDDENLNPESETSTGSDLSDLLYAFMFWDVNGNSIWEPGGGDAAIYGTNNTTYAQLSAIAANYNENKSLAASGTIYITMYWRWPNTANDNDAQGDKTTFTFEVDLEQTAD